MKKRIRLYDRYDAVSFANLQSLEENIWVNDPNTPEGCIVFNATLATMEGVPTSIIMTEPYDVISCLIHGNSRDVFRGLVSNENFPFVHVFTYDNDLVNFRPDRVKKIFPGTPTWIGEADRKIHDKTKNVSMITSRKTMTSGHRIRVNIADFIRDTVDLYGRDYGVPVENKVEAHGDYRFSIVVENDIINGWHTEKILDCFMTGTIPVYYGDPDIGSLYDTEGIISLVDFFGSEDPTSWDMSKFDELNEELYQSKMSSIQKNFDTARELHPRYQVRSIVDQICGESFS